jgi:hypothetical protein
LATLEIFTLVAATRRTSIGAGWREPIRVTSLLQHSEQFDLHRQWQIADLIEKQGAAVRGFKPLIRRWRAAF